MNKFSKALEKRAQDKARKKEMKKYLADDPNKTVAGTNNRPLKKAGRETAEENGTREKRIFSSAHVNPCIVALHDPRSNVSEQYRTLRTNLKTVHKKPVKTIVVSSSIEGEGKTVTALNLAFTFAQDRTKKVLLVDADMRRSSVARYLGCQNVEQGIVKLLEGEVSIEDVIMYAECENLPIIPGSNHGSVYNAAELLGAQSMKKLIAWASEEYDYVVFDTPPIIPVTDAAVLGTQVDGTVLAFRAGKTQKKTILHAQQMFEQANINILGYVMTNVEYLSPGNRDYYYYNYNYARD